MEDEIRKKRKAELMMQLNEIKEKMKKPKEERFISFAKFTNAAPNKLSEIKKLCTHLAEESKRHKAELREAYSNREPLILRFNSQEHPSYTAASRTAFSEDEVGKEA